MQRFGRGARNMSSWSLGIAIVEPAQFDDERAKMAAATSKAGGPASKRRKGNNGGPTNTNITQGQTNASDSRTISDSQAADSTAPITLFLSQKRDGSIKPGSDPALDDFVNAKQRLHLRCFRVVVRRHYYHPNQSRSSYSWWCFLFPDLFLSSREP